MAEPKIIIEKEYTTKEGLKPIFLPADVHAMVKEVSKQSGVSMSRITVRLIKHGLKYVEIVEGDDVE